MFVVSLFKTHAFFVEATIATLPRDALTCEQPKEFVSIWTVHMWLFVDALEDASGVGVETFEVVVPSCCVDACR